MIKIVPLNNSHKNWFLKCINEKSSRYQDKADINITKDMFPLFFKGKDNFWNIIQKDGVNVGLFNIVYKHDRIKFGIIVKKEFRRRGVAKNATVQFLKETDKQKMPVYLEVFEDNPARKLYKQLGFKETGEYKIIRNRKFIEMLRMYV